MPFSPSPWHSGILIKTSQIYSFIGKEFFKKKGKNARNMQTVFQNTKYVSRYLLGSKPNFPLSR
jgi:hypothetical protein